MTFLRFLSLSVCLISFALPVLAERELHVVSVQEGWVKRWDFESRPQARVVVDRPGAEVVLVLLDPGDVIWKVQTSKGSFIENIVLGGNDAKNSGVFLYDVPFSSPKELGLPFVRFAQGASFRHLLSRLSQITGITKISSFQSNYKAKDTDILVKQAVVRNQKLQTNYLEDQLWKSEDWPVELQRLLTNHVQIPKDQVVFNQTGMTLIGDAGQRIFPIPNEIEPPFLPAGAYFDRSTNRLYGISYGGDGFVYQVNIDNGRWDVLANLKGYDGAELIYHSDSGIFVITGAQNKPNDLALLDANGQIENRKFELRSFAGFTDLYDYPNSRPPRLIPSAFDGSWLVLEANSNVSNPRAGYGLYRKYALNLSTNEVRLLEFRDR